ncbi:MAG: hypothetical protein ACREHG_00675, partial [Candidatus Saccharimonadales bacterium]
MKKISLRTRKWVMAACGFSNFLYGLKSFRLWLAASIIAAVMAPATAGAVTPISQGFLINGNPPIGSIVSLKQNSSDYVNVSTPGNVSNLLGVVIGDNSLLSLSTDQANQVQVATSGLVQALVSSINGDISTGDQITASPIGGVGMKATDNVKVLGIAQGPLNDSNGSTQSYTDKNGKHSVLVGEVPVLISVAYFYKQPNKTIIPAAIQNLADALAGKSV